VIDVYANLGFGVLEASVPLKDQANYGR